VWLATLLAALSWAPFALAKTPQLENRCPRLTAAGYEELDARVKLLLRADDTNRGLPVVVCTAEAAWVEWGEERLTVLPRLPLEDEFLDVIEARVHRDARAREADPKTTETKAIESGEPVLAAASEPAAAPAKAQRADPLALRASDARGGGIAVGVQIEPPSDTIGFAVGPAFDFGGSIGPLLIQGREAFRFASADERSVLFMDFEAGLGFGAPLNPDARFGVVARFGAEWLIAYPEGNSGQAAAIPIAALGLRIAERVGPASVWLGLDGHFRLTELSLRSSSPIVANDVTAILTLGVAFVDWSRK